MLRSLNFINDPIIQCIPLVPWLIQAISPKYLLRSYFHAKHLETMWDRTQYNTRSHHRNFTVQWGSHNVHSGNYDQGRQCTRSTNHVSPGKRKCACSRKHQWERRHLGELWNGADKRGTKATVNWERRFLSTHSLGVLSLYLGSNEINRKKGIPRSHLLSQFPNVFLHWTMYWYYTPSYPL